MSRKVVARRERRGFTLLQLLGVIAVVAVLSAIALPVFVGARGPKPSGPGPDWQQQGTALGTARWEQDMAAGQAQERQMARLHRAGRGVK